MPDTKNATAVRTKFECHAIAENDSGTCTTVSLQAVYGDGTDNSSWAEATPWGNPQMAITNPAAVGAFQVSQAYYLDITPVPGKAVSSIAIVDEDGTDGSSYFSPGCRIRRAGAFPR